MKIAENSFFILVQDIRKLILKARYIANTLTFDIVEVYSLIVNLSVKS